MRKLFFLSFIFYTACTAPEEKKVNELPKKADTTIIENDDSNLANLNIVTPTPLPVIKKIKYPNGIYQTVVPLSDETEQIIAFNKDFTYQLQEKYANEKKDSIVTIEGNWMPSDGFIWLYKDQVAMARYKWKGDTLQYYSPAFKKSFAMKPMRDAMQDTTWKNKGGHGISFFGAGKESSWNIEVNDKDSVSFSLAEWKQPLSMKIDSSFTDDENLSYTAHNDSVQLHVTIFPHFCSDGVSSFIYRNRVRVQYNQQVFNGCGLVYKP